MQFNLPTSDLFIEIFSSESRFHFTVGVGDPVARQRSVTFEPSRTITSLELNESSMFGGTIYHNMVHLTLIVGFYYVSKSNERIKKQNESNETLK